MRPGDVRVLAWGFQSDKKEFYPFERFHPDLFLTDWEVETRLGKVNSRDASEALTNKLFFHYSLEAAGLDDRAPDLVGTISQSRFHPHRSDAGIEDVLRHEPLFLKPISGAGGRGVRLLTRVDEVPPTGTFIVQRRVAQHEYASTIFPDSLNTIRVVTMRDEEGTFVAGAAQRFGSVMTGPMDKLNLGGVTALVDLDTGRMTHATSLPGFHARTRHACHPDTGATIEGVAVAGWEAVHDLALRLADVFPGLHHAGWDMCVSPDGPVVVEGNAGTVNPGAIQAHRPLLADPRTFRFLERHGVITRRHAARLRASTHAEI